MFHRPFSRTSLTAAAACAAALIAGCSSSGGHPSGGAAASGSSPAQVMALVASRASRIDSFAATMDISTTTGTTSTQVTGTAQYQLKPSLLASENLSVTTAGTTVPGGMQVILTSNAIYMKMSVLSHLVGKPWVYVPFSALKKSAGVSFAPLVHEVQGNDPLSFAQMLSAATQVRRVGTATVGGVAVTEYAGTYSIARGLAKLGPSLRKLLQPTMAAAGLTSADFKVWVDSQGDVRKLSETESGATATATTVMTITSINQPVTIQPPPSSEMATMPGL